MVGVVPARAELKWCNVSSTPAKFDYTKDTWYCGTYGCDCAFAISTCAAPGPRSRRARRNRLCYHENMISLHLHIDVADTLLARWMLSSMSQMLIEQRSAVSPRSPQQYRISSLGQLSALEGEAQCKGVQGSASTSALKCMGSDRRKPGGRRPHMPPVLLSLTPATHHAQDTESDSIISTVYLRPPWSTPL